MELVWTTKALQDTKLLIKIFGRNGPGPALELADEILSCLSEIQLLAGKAGETGLVDGTREMDLLHLYALVFKVVGKEALIISCSINIRFLTKSLDFAVSNPDRKVKIMEVLEF